MPHRKRWGSIFCFLRIELRAERNKDSLILHRVLREKEWKYGKAFIGVSFRSVKTAAPHLLNEVRGYLCVSFHNLFKAEHFIRSLAVE